MKDLVASTETIQPQSHKDTKIVVRDTLDLSGLGPAGFSFAPTSESLSWEMIAYQVLLSRALDSIEAELLKSKQVSYQFSSHGQELPQVILASLLNNPNDAIATYYRSRPLLIALGVSQEDILAASLGRMGSFSNGRDTSVACNIPGQGRHPTVLPMFGDVGSQYSCGIGWAQALVYKSNILRQTMCRDAIAVVHGGDGSVASNGFWAGLNIATTLSLPVLFIIENNGYAISTPSTLQTPGGNIARNLSSFANLAIFDGEGIDPTSTEALLRQAVSTVRERVSPALVHLRVPRIHGHSGQDTQSYRSEEELKEARDNDPLVRIKKLFLSTLGDEKAWLSLERVALDDAHQALEHALHRNVPDPRQVTRHLFLENAASQAPEYSLQGGSSLAKSLRSSSLIPQEGVEERINFVNAIRRTLDHELSINPEMVVFGEDVGKKGGVHAATLGLQEKHGADRVFDSSLSEEGIVGRAIGMACAGLLPVPEIQFRKYVDPATEQIHNCGMMRWRTCNHFSAPMVLRIPVGHSRISDPAHASLGTSSLISSLGWRIAMPSNAADATGLLRTALRGHDPVFFLEHRSLLDASYSRRPYPGDQYALEFGKARIVRTGTKLTVVTWGAMLNRVESAAQDFRNEIEIIDLRTLVPWDKDCVFESVHKTKRCLIVDEDAISCSFASEIAATIVSECFLDLDAPIKRLAVPDTPIPYNVGLAESVLPDKMQIANEISRLLDF